ncbi:CopD family protein [Mucilaginibacter terrae]|uniref:Protoporphyrinogen IX oxidase n=1 Tax=Mucilaginibacter terrae TaxID=1955052 RepID=A0ABU3GSI4_9SPHI|nr:CopD family protein [Mucilaginibacter terrae]MDT3402734.1 putative membrane protein [Mucilaginibacter terrae]
MYLYIKAIHIIFVVSWMAGLFYGVRLFIYHTEAQDKPEVERNILTAEYERIEKRLFNIIATPAMILTLLAGITLVYLDPTLMRANWLIVKLCFVVGLVAYHLKCQSMMDDMRHGIFKWTSFQLRLWNEVATIFLFAIVFLAVLKSAVDWLYGMAGLIAFAMIIMSAVKIYKNYRVKKGIK